MKISMHAMSVELFVSMLGNLAAILDKAAASAEARKFESSVLASARLAPDMLPFTRQIQLACDFAKNSTARLAGQDPPKFEDNEATLAELKARIDKTLVYLQGVPAGALEGCEDRQITIPLRDRKLEMRGLPFLQRWVLPNFYFHVTTAYAILRHNGVDLGKMDYLGRDTVPASTAR
ncbi:MAG: DUF1993 domain-containing protein [Gammaproteobacteria bacterium]|nr:DUF1993 domain-containing protein [Gammaproteobacteria bacterium]